MFEGIKDNIAQTVREMRHLDIGQTATRIKRWRKRRNDRKTHRRELIETQEGRLTRYHELLRDGHSRDDDGMKKLWGYIVKLDNDIDDLGVVQADLTRTVRKLKGIKHEDEQRRDELIKKLHDQRQNLRQHRREERQRIRRIRRQQQNDDPNGLEYFDGKPVAAWYKPILVEKRNNGSWSGYLLSGYRTPEYSEQLCYQICGQPFCPGRCAGRSSKHSQLGYHEGAIDTTDPYRLRASTNGVLKNFLPNDPNHSSYQGN